jgi:hypothetical protein
MMLNSNLCRAQANERLLLAIEKPDDAVTLSGIAIGWQTLADQIDRYPVHTANEIARFPEVCCDGPVPEEACERSLVASPPFLPALAVSSPSFSLRLPRGQCLS